MSRIGRTTKKGYRLILLVTMLVVIALGLLRGVYPLAATGDTRVANGYYLYQLPPDEEGRDSTGKPKAVSFSEGRLTDGNLKKTGKAVCWKRSPVGTMSVVFDLLGDRALENISIAIGPNPNGWHAMATMAVSYRAERDAKLRVADMKLMWPGGSVVPYRVDGDGDAILRGAEMKLIRRGGVNKAKVLDFPMNGQMVRYIQIRFGQYTPRKIQIHEVVIEEAENGQYHPTVPGQTDVQALLEEAQREPLLVDRWGQALYEDWPGKIQSDDQLVQEASTEAQQLASVSRDRERFDEYGGLKEADRNFSATGFFRTEKIDGRWWFITPQGNRFILIGVDCLVPVVRISPYQADGKTPREAFAELPDTQAYPDAYYSRFTPDKHGDPAGKSVLDFLLVNLYRKYGENALEEWYQVTDKRMLDWGFNGGASWSPTNPTHERPYLRNVLSKGFFLNGPGPDRIAGTRIIDPFYADFRKDIEAVLKTVLLEEKDSEALLGYIFDNETGWNYRIFDLMLRQKSDCAAKRAFVEFLKKRHGQLAAINKMLGTKAPSFAALADQPIKPSKISLEDRSEFLHIASRLQFSTIREVINEYDPNHLFLGGAWIGAACEEWITGGLEYIDVFTFTAYINDPKLVNMYDKYDKPCLLTEFGFSVFGRGLGGLAFAKTHRGRGLFYRWLVEQTAANPNMIGWGWFKYNDNFPDVGGFTNDEYFNMGLVNIVDQPYYDMIEEIKKTNARLFDIHAGKLPPIKRKDMGIEPAEW